MIFTLGHAANAEVWAESGPDVRGRHDPDMVLAQCLGPGLSGHAWPVGACRIHRGNGHGRAAMDRHRFHAAATLGISENHLGDGLGGLLRLAGCKERDRLVFEHCKSFEVPVAVSMGGGYSNQLTHIVEGHANTYRVAQELYF